jgi:hypothetical protein
VTIDAVKRNVYPYLIYFLSDFGEIRYKKSDEHFVSSIKIGAGKVTLFLRAYMKLHLRVYRETANLQSTELLGKVYIMRHGVYQLKF